MDHYLIVINGTPKGYTARQGTAFIEGPNPTDVLGAAALLMNLDPPHRTKKCQVQLEGLAKDSSFRRAITSIVDHHNTLVDCLMNTREPISAIVD